MPKNIRERDQMISYDHHQIVVRVPLEEYRRLKTIQTKRLLVELHDKDSGRKAKKISLHDIVLEAIETFREDVY
jgi:hypothetical protein